jgi:hypothetical protein
MSISAYLFCSLIPNSLMRLRNSPCRGKNHGGRIHSSKGSDACSNKGCSGGTSVRGDGAVRPAVPGDDLQRDTQSMPFPSLSLSTRTRKLCHQQAETLFRAQSQRESKIAISEKERLLFSELFAPESHS